MRCRGCDYELWNMRPGACSECGRPWRFENFRFRPLAVQFLCPHCDHIYAGTDEQGLPTPRAFICTGCSTPIDLDQMRALPAPGTDGSTAMDDEHAWSERARIGRWRAFWRTVGQSLGSPSQLARTLPQRPVLWGAILFSLLCATLGIACGSFPIVFLIGMSSGQLSSGVEYVLKFAGICAAIIVGAAIIGQLVFFLWGAAAHAILLVTGGVRRPLSHTLSTTLYCSGPFLISAVPCCGFYLSVVSLVWMAVAMIIALGTLHRVSGVRASIAVLTPLLLVLASLVLSVALGIYFIGNKSASHVLLTPSQTPLQTPSQPPSQTPADASDPQVLPSSGPEAPKE